MSIWEMIRNAFMIKPKPEEIDPYIEKIKEKGFRYNEVDDRWQRVWATVIPDGIETVLEVRKKDDEGWKYILYDNNENLFYEELVDD